MTNHEPAALPATMPCGRAGLVSTGVLHEVKTAVVRDDMVGWVQSGTKTLVTSRAPVVYRPGDVFLLRRGTQWNILNDPMPGGRYLAQGVAISPEVVRDFGLTSGLRPAGVVRDAARFAVDDEFSEALLRAARSLDAPQTSTSLQRHRLVEVLLLLNERGWRFEAGEAPPWDDRVRRFIGQSPQLDWTIERLATAFHVSASTLRRRMGECDCTLGDVVREVRLETGLAMLQCTPLPVGDIAARCGYQSHSRFTAAFRARFGFAPSTLRPRSAHGHLRTELGVPGAGRGG